MKLVEYELNYVQKGWMALEPGTRRGVAHTNPEVVKDLPELILNENYGSEQAVEEIIKPYIQKAVKDDGQSDKYMKSLWLVWWGIMSSDIKHGLVKAFQSLGVKPRRPVSVTLRVEDDGTLELRNNRILPKSVKYAEL